MSQADGGPLREAPERPATGSWEIGRTNLPYNVKGLCREIGPVTYIEGHLTVVAAGNVYNLSLEAKEQDILVRYRRLGPLGKVEIEAKGEHR